jgi:hypothetical protein
MAGSRSGECLASPRLACGTTHFLIDAPRPHVGRRRHTSYQTRRSALPISPLSFPVPSHPIPANPRGIAGIQGPQLHASTPPRFKGGPWPRRRVRNIGCATPRSFLPPPPPPPPRKPPRSKTTSPRPILESRKHDCIRSRGRKVRRRMEVVLPPATLQPSGPFQTPNMFGGRSRRPPRISMYVYTPCRVVSCRVVSGTSRQQVSAQNGHAFLLA